MEARAALRKLGPALGLGALLLGMALGALFPRELAPLGQGTRAGFGLLAAVAPFVIFLTLAPALLAMLRAGKAARVGLAAVGAFVATTALAGLLAVALAVPAFQLGLTAGAGGGGAGWDPGALAAVLRSPPFVAIEYSVAVAVLLHLGSPRPLAGRFCRPTARVLERGGTEGIALLGKGIKAAFAPLLFAIGVFIPTGAQEALAAGERALAGQGLAGLGGSSPVAWYFMTVLAHVVLLAAFVVAALLVLRRVARFPLRRFLADYALYVYPFAWATASSAATIPINLERVGLGLGVRREVRDLLVPVGATLNRPGSMTSAVILTVVASLLLGVRPGALDLLVLLLPLTLVIVAAPSVPAGTAVVAPPVILSVLPIPPEAHAAFAALFFAFGVGLTDQFRTGVNAIGTGVLCVLFDRAWPALSREPAPAPGRAPSRQGPRAPSAVPRRAPRPPRVRSLPREP